MPDRKNDIDVQPVRRSMRIGTWLRLAVSLGLIAWIAAALDWPEVAGLVRDANLYYLTLSLLLTPITLTTGVMKWRMLLNVRGIHATTVSCFVVYLIGMFFNNFLPTNFGGDAVRAFLVGKTTGHYAVATASVFTERFLGVTIFIFMIPLALALSPSGMWSIPIQIYMGIVALAYLVLLWIVLDYRFHRLFRLGEQNTLLRKLICLQEAIMAYRRHGRIILTCLALSLLFYVLAVCNVYISLLAFNIELRIASVFVVTTVVLVLAMLPIAINGMGLAEWAYLFALSQFGVSPAAAVAVALLIRLKTLGWSLLGGAIYCSGYRAAVSTTSPLPSSPAAQKQGIA